MPDLLIWDFLTRKCMEIPFDIIWFMETLNIKVNAGSNSKMLLTLAISKR